MLSAGTDGIDGNSAAAGAVVDGDSVARLQAITSQPDLSDGSPPNFDGALKNFDTYPAFSALGDAIVTGATGNNVRDLRILFAY